MGDNKSRDGVNGVVNGSVGLIRAVSTALMSAMTKLTVEGQGKDIMSRDKYNSLSKRECERIRDGQHPKLKNETRASQRLAGMKGKQKK